MSSTFPSGSTQPSWTPRESIAVRRSLSNCRPSRYAAAAATETLNLTYIIRNEVSGNHHRDQCRKRSGHADSPGGRPGYTSCEHGRRHGRWHDGRHGWHGRRNDGRHGRRNDGWHGRRNDGRHGRRHGRHGHGRWNVCRSRRLGERPITSGSSAQADLDLNHWITRLDAARQADDDQQLERLNARVQAVVHNQVQLAERTWKLTRSPRPRTSFSESFTWWAVCSVPAFHNPGCIRR